MTAWPSAEQTLFDSPARYQICVRGWINWNWSDRLEGMDIKLDVDDGGHTTCTLEGELLDQAALLGVLVTLYELHLPVLLVKCLTYPAPSNS